MKDEFHGPAQTTTVLLVQHTSILCFSTPPSMRQTYHTIIFQHVPCQSRRRRRNRQRRTRSGHRFRFKPDKPRDECICLSQARTQARHHSRCAIHSSHPSSSQLRWDFTATERSTPLFKQERLMTAQLAKEWCSTVAKKFFPLGWRK